jgi:membrane protease YdiL (CAAX protease family)
MHRQRWIAALVIAGLAASAGASTCALADRAAGNRAEALALQGFGFELFLGLLALAGAALSAAPLRERLGLGRSRLSGGTIALLALGTIALSHALDAIIDLGDLAREGVLADLEQTLAGIRGRTLAWVLLGLGLAPGVAEELLCRGLIQRGLVPRLGAAGGVLVASLVFGLLHLDPVHSAFACVLGLYLGALSRIADSVRAAIACHAANNLCAVFLAGWQPALGVPPAASIALGGGFALAVLSWVHTRARRLPADCTNRAELEATASRNSPYR